MDPKFQTSFIPKKTLVTPSAVPHRRTTNVFSMFSFIIFASVLVLAVGVWGWSYYIQNNNNNLKATLDSDLSQFQPTLISQLSHLDTRIETAKMLLSQHVALTQFFNFLGSVTLKSVRFSSFKYSIASKNGVQKITISLSGQAQSFASVALQEDEFLKPENTQYLQNPSFSNLNVDQNGNVLFDFTASLNPTVISYQGFLDALNTSGNTSPSAPAISNSPQATVPASSNQTSASASSDQGIPLQSQ